MPSSKNVSKKPHISIASSQKSAKDALLESFGDLIDEAAERMTPKEFEEAARKSNATLDRAIAEHSRRRGTA
jgi:hypothetical protein